MFIKRMLDLRRTETLNKTMFSQEEEIISQTDGDVWVGLRFDILQRADKKQNSAGHV
jgi:hypothetical protein